MNLLKISFQFEITLNLNKALVVKIIYICADEIKTYLKQHTRNKRTQPVNW